MTTPNVALFGLFGSANLGNEATLAAFLHHLKQRFPGARVVCISRRDSKVATTFGLELVDMEPMPMRHYFGEYRTQLIRRWAPLAQRLTEPLRGKRAKDTIREFDLVLVPGTGVLDDFGQTALDLPAHLMRWCRAARNSAIPVYFLSVGAEPVHGVTTQRYLRRAAEVSAYRSYRDDESKQNATNMGVTTLNDPVYPDLAFSLPTDGVPQERPAHWPPRRVGLGVMGYYGWNKPGEEGERTYQLYIAKMKKLLAWLLERGYTVQLLVGDTRADDRPMRELADAFKGGPHGQALIAEPVADFRDLLRQIASTDVVIATRLHNVLLSLLYERPVISISYSRKTDVLLEEFGLGEYVQPIDSFEVDQVIAQFEHLVAQANSPVEAIRAKVALYRRLLDEQYERVFAPLAR